MSILWLTGCSEEVRVIKPGSTVPVVFGVFDLNQTVHYVKLSKTFAGETDPYTLAQDRNQIFYPDAEVFITGESGSGRIPFKPETGIPRFEGSFPPYPNEVYRLYHQLDPGNYRLTIILPSEKDTLTAGFTFISTFKVLTPKAGFKRFYFYEDPVLFSWVADPAAGLYEINILLKYEEWMKTGESKSCSVNFSRQIHPVQLERDQDRCNYRFYSDSFFAFLGTTISRNDAVNYRKPVALELMITAADTTLSRYLDWFDLEIDDKVNPNGNVDGAIGVIATKYSVPFPDLILSPRSQDSLVKGRHTKNLAFVNNPDW